MKYYEDEGCKETFSLLGGEMKILRLQTTKWKKTDQTDQTDQTENDTTKYDQCDQNDHKVKLL